VAGLGYDLTSSHPQLTQYLYPDMWEALHFGHVICSGDVEFPPDVEGFKNTRISSGAMPSIGGSEGRRKVGISIRANVKPAHTKGFLRFDWAIRIDQSIARPRDM